MRVKTAITGNTARKKEGCVAFANDDFENARRVKYYWEIIDYWVANVGSNRLARKSPFWQKQNSVARVFIEQTRLSAVTVWRYRKKGMLTTVNICGRHYILRAEIARF